MDIDNVDFDLPTSPGREAPIASLRASSPLITSPISVEGGPDGQSLPAEAKRWTCVWPLYLDSTRSVERGRRVCLADAHPHPNLIVMAHAVAELQLPLVVEAGKRHPQDPFLYGRLRVKLPESAAAPVRTKKALVRFIARNYGRSKAQLAEHPDALPPQMRQLMENLDYSSMTESRLLEKLYGSGASAADPAPSSGASGAASGSGSQKKAGKGGRKGRR